MNDIREKIKTKIQALLNKTVENGCTEQEAYLAAFAVGKLMTEYDLSYKDIRKEINEEQFGVLSRQIFFPKGVNKTSHPIVYVVSAIAAFFDCQSWRQGNFIIFFGEKSDCENAHSMLTMLKIAIDQDTKSYMKKQTSCLHGKTVRTSFSMGMCSRLNTRLLDMKKERVQNEQQAKPNVSSNALVVAVKSAVVSNRFEIYSDAKKLKLKKATKSKVNIRSKDAYDAGKNAADKTNIGSKKLSESKMMIS